MPLAIYKAKPNKNGTACSFSFNSKDQAMFISFIKQVSWDDQKKVGSFKGGDQCNVKFSMGEIGSLIDTIEKGRTASGYHSSANQTTTYTFAPYLKDEKLAGFSLSVFRKGKEDGAEKRPFQIGFNFGEAVMLREYFRSVLGRMYTAIYSEDKARYENAIKNNGNDNRGSEETATTPKKRGRPAKAASAPAKDSPVHEADPFADDPFVAPTGTVETATSDLIEEAANSSNNTQETEDVF